MTRIIKKSSNSYKSGTRIPLDFHIEIMPKGRAFRVLVGGARAVKSFASECVVLRLKRRTLKITGDGLEIASLEDSVVEISGFVKEFELLNDKF